MTDRHAIVMEEVTDPVELAKARAQRERFDRNAAWRSRNQRKRPSQAVRRLARRRPISYARFPREFRRQLTRGWGKEVFRQLFGPPPRYYRGR